MGGNDALREAHILDAKAHSVADALDLITAARLRFRSTYARMLDLSWTDASPVRLHDL
jgi:hypothetical protein